MTKESPRSDVRPSVAVVGRYYNKQGGVSNVMAQLVERMVDDFEINVVSSEFLDWDQSEARAIEVPMVTNPRFLQIPSFSHFARDRVARLAPALVHSHDPQMIGADLYTAHSSFSRYIRIMRERSSVFKRGLSHFYPPHFAGLYMARQCWTRSDSTIVAVSESVRQDLLSEYGFPEQRIVVIPNGVDTNAFASPDPLECRERLQRELQIPLTGSLLLIFIGYEFKRKGLAVAIDAFARLRTSQPDLDTHFLVVGGADPAEYIEQTKRAGLFDQIHFLGHRSDVPSLLRASDLFVFPTTYEASGLVILEAAAAGLGIVTPSLAGAAEVLHHQYDAWLLHDPNDVEELANALERLATTPALLAGIRENARSVGEANDWSVMANHYTQLYHQVIAKKQFRG